MEKQHKQSSFEEEWRVAQDASRMAYLSTAQQVLNPTRKHLTVEAKKRLGWIYELERHDPLNITMTAKKVGASREWLSKLYTIFVDSGRDPRSLEPASRSPRNTTKRKRIPQTVENLIVSTRKKYPAWGKEKITRILKRNKDIIVSPSTVGRYLKKHHLENPKLSRKNRTSARRKRNADRERPPRGLSDAAPGSLLAKDMKLVPKAEKLRKNKDISKARSGELFWYQHTLIDSCTRMRAVSYVASSDARISRAAYEEATKRLPFQIAAVTHDNGSENAGAFSKMLQEQNIIQFWSRPGTPTDNPRVERSHRTDEEEFYALNSHIRESLDSLVTAGLKWEQTYNEIRPHQALGYLTPQEFYELWLKDRQAAEKILLHWNIYLAKQSLRLRASRKEKKETKIRALNAHLTAVLGTEFTHLTV